MNELIYKRHSTTVNKETTAEGVAWRINSCDFLDVKIFLPDTNHNNNGDQYVVTLTTNGQDMIANEEDVSEIKFTIVGPIEFSEFLRAMCVLGKVWKNE